MSKANNEAAALVIEERDIGEIMPYDRNPRKNQKAVEHVLESLRRHGQAKPLVLSAAGHPFEGEVVCCGHTTLEALKRFGAKRVGVVVKAFKDEAEFVDLNIRDNKTGEWAEWDDDELSMLAVDFDIDLDAMGFGGDEQEEPYTMKVESIHYEPRGERPSIDKMVDAKKYDQMVMAIADADISDDERRLLTLAATRHIVFNYEQIAEFYAHAPKAVQEMMEHSALVIIDFEDAIDKGYVKMSEAFCDMLRGGEE